MGTLGRYHKLPRRLESDYDVNTGSVLGEGVNGSVCRAVNRFTGDSYAIKPIKTKGLDHDLAHELINEVTFSLCLDHPHIGRVHDIYEAEDNISLVVELCSGGDICERLMAERRFSENEAQHAVYQMLLAVNYLHGHDIVHRDIKLENFMYTKKDGNFIKLIDFGFCRMCSRGHTMDRILGTLQYMAPEVIDGEYDSACDMWSLGVTGFALLTGKMPFSGSDDDDLTRKIQRGRVFKGEAWESISGEGWEFVQNLLRLQPSSRMTCAGALYSKWITDRGDGVDDLMGQGLDQGIYDALIHWSTMSHFRRACLRLVAWSLTTEERLQFWHAFRELDVSNNGAISASEFKAVLKTKFGTSDEEAMRVYSTMRCSDATGADEIGYTNFLSAALIARITVSDSRLKDTFHRFEPDGNDTIARERVENVLQLPPGKFDGHWEKLDANGDGDVSVTEFIAYVRSELPADAACEDLRPSEASLPRMASPLPASWQPSLEVPSLRGLLCGASLIAALALGSSASRTMLTPRSV